MERAASTCKLGVESYFFCEFCFADKAPSWGAQSVECTAIFGGFVGAVHKVNACGRRNVGFLGDTMGDVVVHRARCFNVIVTKWK